MCVCMCECVCVCMCVCVCVCIYMYVCIYICIYMCHLGKGKVCISGNFDSKPYQEIYLLNR